MARDITKLHPELQKKIALFKEECKKQGLIVNITSCVRNAAEQLDCYKRGTTKLKYPDSHHNWGTAFDICRGDGKGAYYNNDKFFEKCGAVGKKLGLIWGGDFSHPDRPHFQLSQWGKTITRLKNLYGTPEKFMKTWPSSNASASTPSNSTTERPSNNQTISTYKVQKGDTLSAIAKKYATTYKVLADLNGLKSPYMLLVGQVLKLPSGSNVAATKTNYVVVSTKSSNLICRSSASKNSKVVGTFKKGVKLTLVKKTTKDWYQVKGKDITGSTITGYCSAAYLKTV